MVLQERQVQAELAEQMVVQELAVLQERQERQVQAELAEQMVVQGLQVQVVLQEVREHQV